MKKIITVLALISLILFCAYARKSTFTLGVSFAPAFETEKNIALPVSRIDYKGQVSGKFHFKYRSAWGIAADAGVGIAGVTKTSEGTTKTSDLVFDLFIGALYKGRTMRSNKFFGTIAIGPSLKKPLNPSSTNFLDFLIGIGAHVDIEYLFGEHVALNLGAKYTFNFIEFYKNSSSLMKAKKTIVHDVTGFVGLTYSFNI